MPILVDGNKIKKFNFSGGECQVSLPTLDVGSNIAIDAALHNSDDVMSLLLTVDAIRRCNSSVVINLTIPYFPYARQDRVCNKGEALSVKVMADLINSLNCATVTIFDPHSDVTPALINNCVVITMEDIICGTQLMKKIVENKIHLVSPDAGAEKKVRNVAKHINSTAPDIEVILAAKARDTKTGTITNTHVYGDVRGKNIIILDDICDGGRTFIELVKVLVHQGAKDIYLYVTHGIFSNGLSELNKYFKHVYCYHLFNDTHKQESNFLTILEGEYR